MEGEANEDLKMSDDQCSVNKEDGATKSQKVNNFSIDSLLSNTKNSCSDIDDRCSVQCSSAVTGGDEVFSNFSARLRYDGNIASELNNRRSIEEQNALRSSHSCPSASFSRSFSEGD